MAVKFDSANNERFLRTTDLLDYNGVWSASYWIYAVTGSSVQTTFCINDGTSNNQDRLSYSASEALQCTVAVLGSSTTVGTMTFSGNTWYHIGLSRDSATSLWVYVSSVDGTLVDSAQNTRDITTRVASATRVEFGGRLASTASFNGRVAHIKLWSAALTQSELQLEMFRIRPHRTANLYGWWPVFPGST